MVIGNGMLAKCFMEYETDNSVLLFCSGVSNSLCIEKSEYGREFLLLKEILSKNSDKLFVYFSTCSIEDDSLSENMYIKHKIELENYIKSNAKSFLIARLSNVVGVSKNNHTILNFFYNSISKGLAFDLWVNSYRNMIDVSHVKEIVSFIIGNNLYTNKTINIANKVSVSSLSIVEKIERFLNVKAKYNLIGKGAKFNIDISEIEPILLKLNMNFTENYIESLLKKYYV